MVVVPWEHRESLQKFPGEDKLFIDSRYGVGLSCLYCGGAIAKSSREHIPSKTLLDKDVGPWPPHMPTVPCCEPCNNGYSLDEEFIAAAVECWRCGTTSPDRLERNAIGRALARSEGMRVNIEQTLIRDGLLRSERFWKVADKLVRAHVFYEQQRSPVRVKLHANRLCDLTEEQLNWFEEPPEVGLAGWPEIGSRQYVDACMFMGHQPWWELREDCYRYSVTEAEPVEVRIVMSEFLAIHGRAWLDDCDDEDEA